MAHGPTGVVMVVVAVGVPTDTIEESMGGRSPQNYRINLQHGMKVPSGSLWDQDSCGLWQELGLQV